VGVLLIGEFMNVVITMRPHPEGLHAAHKEIIEFAKTFGDVTVRILDLEGRDLSKQADDFNDLGVKHRFLVPSTPLTAEEKQEFTDRAVEMIAPYKDELKLVYYYNWAIPLITGYFRRLKEKENNVDIVVSGPQVIAFFMKRIAEDYKWPVQFQIYPKQIKNPETGMSYSGSIIKNVPKSFWPKLKEIRKAIDQNKADLAKKQIPYLNKRIEDPAWKFENFYRWEGGIIDGRIDVTKLQLFTNNGSFSIGEVDYYYKNKE
jgi:hypothetical protein